MQCHVDLHVDRQNPWPGPTVLEWSPARRLSPCWGIRVCAENRPRCPQLSGSYSTGSSKAGAGQRSVGPGSWARLSQVPPRCPFTALTPILHLWNQGSEIPHAGRCQSNVCAAPAHNAHPITGGHSGHSASSSAP